MQTPERPRRLNGTAPDALPADCTAAELFDALWRSMVDMLGPTATATLIERSAGRATAKRAGLEHPTIFREQFSYRHRTPPSWAADNRAALIALTALVAELWPLLAELTGPIVLRRLREVAPLERCGVLPKDSLS